MSFTSRSPGERDLDRGDLDLEYDLLLLRSLLLLLSLRSLLPPRSLDLDLERLLRSLYRITISQRI